MAEFLDIGALWKPREGQKSVASGSLDREKIEELLEIWPKGEDRIRCFVSKVNSNHSKAPDFRIAVVYGDDDRGRSNGRRGGRDRSRERDDDRDERTSRSRARDDDRKRDRDDDRGGRDSRRAKSEERGFDSDKGDGRDEPFQATDEDVPF